MPAGCATYALSDFPYNVGVLTLNDGKVNTFGFDMIEEVNKALDECERDESMALVIAGTSKALSAGFDLRVMAGAKAKGDEAARQAAFRLVLEGGKLTTRIFGFPKPVVMAGTGHCLALGAILLLAGDVRIAQRGTKARFGLNEAAIGMQLPAFGWRLARYRLTRPGFTMAVTQATVYDAPGAAAVGYLDELVEGDPIEAAVATASRLGQHVKQPAFANMKLIERGDVIGEILENMSEDVAEAVLGPPKVRAAVSGDIGNRVKAKL